MPFRDCSPFSRGVSSPTGRFCLSLWGRFVDDPRLTGNSYPGVDGAVFVRFEAHVFGPCWSMPHHPSKSYANYGCRSLIFPLAQNPEVTREQIRSVISVVPTGRRPIINGGEDELLEFLAESVTSLLRDRTASTSFAPEEPVKHIAVRAHIGVLDTFDLSRAQLRKVTYHNKKDDEAAAAQMVTEKSCPICLEDFGEGEQVHVMPCGHPFHLHCLVKCLRLKAQCPLCRSPTPCTT